MSNVRVHGERIAVKPIYETASKGGIALPQRSRSRQAKGEVTKGIVIEVSKDKNWDPTENCRYHVPQDLIGKIVHYYSGQIFEVTVGEDTYHIIDMGTLLCVEV